MKKEELRIIINQVKKYDLTLVFKSSGDFNKWISSLNAKQIKNFINLAIEPEIVLFPKELLINKDLLNCADYTYRVSLMSKLKGDGCWQLFERLCAPQFLKSKTYYEDMERMSEADNVRYPLWVIAEKSFINSEYHKEDLEHIVNAKDTEDGDLDWLVAEALAEVAKNEASIKSPFHKKDMALIANSGSQCLQMSCSYPKSSLNNLAVDKISLKDPYHLENMKILAKNPIGSRFLYNLMTDETFIKGKFYREEINALLKAKTKSNALAMYYFIVNPKDSYGFEYYEDISYYRLSVSNASVNRRECIKGVSNPNYLTYLNMLSYLDEKYVTYFESLMSNENLMKSSYQDYDINLLLTVNDEGIFGDLYKLMINTNSLNSVHHIEDVILISKTTDAKKRSLLFEKAVDERSLNSENHRYDMNYIANLKLDGLDDDCYNNIRYYLFTTQGLNDPYHIESLEKLCRGEMVQIHNDVSNYLDDLENSLDNNLPIKGFARIRKIFNRKRK
ncbi:MAG: hypothetical protein J6B98_04015 [Bacilli bacterium]|nr:hypothetical protein [Bacilli bacterium]